MKAEERLRALEVGAEYENQCVGLSALAAQAIALLVRSHAALRRAEEQFGIDYPNTELGKDNVRFLDGEEP